MTDVVDTPSEPAEPELTCALEGCDLPLPVRSLDEHGRRRAGRRPLYCSKAHADQASRQRRAADVAAVAEPLAQAESLGRQLLPVSRELIRLGGDLVDRLESAQAGALARIAAAEAEAAEARQDAAEAGEHARQAEQARRQALAEARGASKARDAARQDAAAARREADEVRTQAWERVAAHERARGQSEAARQAADSAAERLVTELRTTTEALDREHAAATETASRLTRAVQDAEQARAEQRAAAAAVGLLESARGEAAADRDRLLAELERVRAELAEARATGSEAALAGVRLRDELARADERLGHAAVELATERAQRQLAEQRLEDARRAVDAGERRLADLQSVLTTLRGPEQPERLDQPERHDQPTD